MGKSWRHLHAGDKRGIVCAVKSETIEIPTNVLMSVETLDELQDWLTAQNPKVIAELRAARREDKAGKFKPWKSRHLACPTVSK
jgi:hypothetical protein